MARSEAVHDERGRRHCAMCGDFIDPIDWCGHCQENQAPCGLHKRLRLRSDAAFCGTECRQLNRSTFMRDCVRQK